MISLDVDVALAEVPVNLVPLTDSTDFVSIEEAVAYNAAGMELIWHFVTSAGAYSATVVTPTTGGTYDWAHQDGGMYTIEIPASGGASINNDTAGYGWFTGKATGVLPWRGPTICFRAAGLNDKLCDSPYSTTRGLSGTALPDAAADGIGGLPISDAGGLDLDARLDAAVSSRMATYAQPTGFLAATFPGGTIANTTNITAGNIATLAGAATVVLTDASLTTAKLGTFALAKGTNITGFNDLSAAQVNAEADTALADAGVTTARTGYLDNLNIGGNVASSAEVTSVQNNTRVVRVVPEDIELPTAGTRTYRVELLLYDAVGNMEAPDSAPTIALVNQAGTDRSARLDSATMALVSTGRYRAVYTSTAGDTKEQLVWSFSVVEGGATRLYGNTSYITDAVATDFTSADRAKLDTLHDTRIPGVIQPQTGDSFARLGLAGAGLTALGDTRIANLDAAITTRMATFTLPTNFSALAITAGGAVTAGTVSDKTGYSISGTTTTLDALQTALNSAHGAGSWATATGFSTHSAADVWSAGTRVLTAGTNIVLAKGTGITGFNDLSAAQVNAEADTALSDVGLTSVITGRIDAAISTRLASASYTAPPTAIENADALLIRNVSNVEASAGEHTLCTVILASLESSRSGTTWTIRRTTGATHVTKQLTVDAAADPVTGVT